MPYTQHEAIVVVWIMRDGAVCVMSSWRTDSPFELLLPDDEWTIAGSSPLSMTYHGTKSILNPESQQSYRVFGTREFDEFRHTK